MVLVNLQVQLVSAKKKQMSVRGPQLLTRQAKRDTAHSLYKSLGHKHQDVLRGTYMLTQRVGVLRSAQTQCVNARSVPTRTAPLEAAAAAVSTVGLPPDQNPAVPSHEEDESLGHFVWRNSSESDFDSDYSLEEVCQERKSSPSKRDFHVFKARVVRPVVVEARAHHPRLHEKWIFEKKSLQSRITKRIRSICEYRDQPRGALLCTPSLSARDTRCKQLLSDIDSHWRTIDQIITSLKLLGFIHAPRTRTLEEGVHK